MPKFVFYQRGRGGVAPRLNKITRGIEGGRVTLRMTIKLLTTLCVCIYIYRRRLPINSPLECNCIIRMNKMAAMWRHLLRSYYFSYSWTNQYSNLLRVFPLLSLKLHPLTVVYKSYIEIVRRVWYLKLILIFTLFFVFLLLLLVRDKSFVSF